MNSVHRFVKSAAVLFLLITIFTSQTTHAATRRPVKAQRRVRADRQEPRSRRTQLRRLAARRRAEAARLVAIARQRAAEEAMRTRVRSMIGKDDITGEDPEIRRVAINALGHHSGTVVVMDPKTGRIYSIVNQQWALREGFKPCSTIKLVTGLAGLNEKIIDPDDTAAISDSNQVDLTRALAFSKNDYFQQVGGRIGFDGMISYARQLGLGERTGINVRNEFQGRVPTFKSGFAVNHMSSHGDDFKVTALQLATLVSAIANGGQLLTPFVPRTPRDEIKFTPRIHRLLAINADAFRRMIPGMIGSVSYGSGRRAFNPRETVAGKTGTCTERGAWVGLFASYAPLNNPQLAVVVIARGADGRGHFPAAVAGQIYRDLNDRFGATSNPEAATRGEAKTFSHNSALTKEKGATISDDEEADDADDDGAASATNDTPVKAAAPRTIWGDKRVPAVSKVKRVLMSIPSRSQAPGNAGVSKDPPKTNPQTMVRARRVTGGRH